MRLLPVVLAIVLLVTGSGFAASSFMGGYSGTILTPDGIITPQRQWDLSFHDFVNVLGDEDLTSWGINYGLLPNLEIGASFVNDGEGDTALNAKYKMIRETATQPGIAIGIFDIAGMVSVFDSDPSLYVMFSKNITRFATNLAGEPSKPLRLNAGLGSGFFDGLTASLDWTMSSNLSLMVEYFGGTLGDNKGMVNAGIRFAASDALRLDAATIDFKDLAVGVNYRLKPY